MFYRYLLVVAAVVLRFRSFDSVYGPQIHRVNRMQDIRLKYRLEISG